MSMAILAPEEATDRYDLKPGAPGQIGDWSYSESMTVLSHKDLRNEIVIRLDESFMRRAADEFLHGVAVAPHCVSANA